MVRCKVGMLQGLHRGIRHSFEAESKDEHFDSHTQYEIDGKDSLQGSWQEFLKGREQHSHYGTQNWQELKGHSVL